MQGWKRRAESVIEYGIVCDAGVVFYNDVIRIGEAGKGKYGTLSQMLMMPVYLKFCGSSPLASDTEKKTAVYSEMVVQFALDMSERGASQPAAAVVQAQPFPPQTFPQAVFPQQAVVQFAPPPPPPGPPPSAAWGGAYTYGQQAAYGYAGPGSGQGGGRGNGASGSGVSRGCWTCGRAGHWGGKCTETLDMNQKPLVPGAQAFKWTGPKPEGPK